MIAGHSFIISYLDRLASKDSLPGAYVFIGPSGVGKRHAACELAKFLQEDHGKSFSIYVSANCSCSSCASVNIGTHPDVTICKSPFGIEDIREIRTILHLSPFTGPYRIVIVDEADRLSDAASQALLKEMEELPPRALLFLIAQSKGALLPTIVSRATVLRFGLVTDKEILEVLGQKGGQELKNLEAFWHGRPGTALALAQSLDMRKDMEQYDKDARILVAGTLGEKFALIDRAAKEKNSQKREQMLEGWQRVFAASMQWQEAKVFEGARRAILFENANPSIALGNAVMQIF